MYNAFSNYNSPYISPVTTGLQYGQSPKQEVTKVNGKEGANAFPLPPNSSVLMLDINRPIVYLKQSDGAGYCSITPYKIEPYTEEETERNDLEKRIKRLEDIINESYSCSIEQARQQKFAVSDKRNNKNNERQD